MKRATRSDWTTKPMPENAVGFPLDMRLSRAQYERLSMGMIPREMEEKWFIFLEDDTLWFHRSWTGRCIYAVTLVPDGDGYRAVAAVTSVAGEGDELHLDDRYIITALICCLTGNEFGKQLNMEAWLATQRSSLQGVSSSLALYSTFGLNVLEDCSQAGADRTEEE